MARNREQSMQERFMDGTGAVQPPPRGSRFPRGILPGLGRLLAWVVVVSTVCVGLGLLVGHFHGSDPASSVPVSLYIGGATLMLVSFGGAVSGRSLSRVAWDQDTLHDEMVRRYQAGRGVYILVGVLVIGVGVFFDWLL